MKDIVMFNMSIINKSLMAMFHISFWGFPTYPNIIFLTQNNILSEHKIETNIAHTIFLKYYYIYYYYCDAVTIK